MVDQFPASFINRLEMLRHIETQEEEKRALREEAERKDSIIQRNGSELQAKNEQKIAEMDQLRTNEIEQLRLQIIRDLNSQSKLLKAGKVAEVTELKSKVTSYENSTKILLQEREGFATQLVEERELRWRLQSEVEKST